MAISHLVKELNINYEETFAERTRLLNFIKNKKKEDELEKQIEKIQKNPEKILEKEDNEGGGLFKNISSSIKTMIQTIKDMIKSVLDRIKSITKSGIGLKTFGNKITKSCHRGALKKIEKRTTRTLSGLKKFRGKGPIMALVAAAIGGVAYSLISNKKPEEESAEELEKEDTSAAAQDDADMGAAMRANEEDATPEQVTQPAPVAAPEQVTQPAPVAAAPPPPPPPPAPPPPPPPAPPPPPPAPPPPPPAPKSAKKEAAAGTPVQATPAEPAPTKQDEKRGEPISEMPKNVKISYPSDPVAKSEMMSRVDKELLNRFYGFAKELGSPVSLNSAYRSDNYQAKLWVRGRILNDPGIHTPAAPKDDQHVELGGKEYDVKGGGKGSTHLIGMGLDISAAGITKTNVLTDSDKLLNKYGLFRPFYAKDAPHIEMIKGSRAPIGDTDVSKNAAALEQKTSADSKTQKTIIATIENNKTQNNISRKAV